MSMPAVMMMVIVVMIVMIMMMMIVMMVMTIVRIVTTSTMLDGNDGDDDGVGVTSVFPVLLFVAVVSVAAEAFVVCDHNNDPLPCDVVRHGRLMVMVLW